MFQHIIYEKKDGVATITLNRPTRYNAFAGSMNSEVTQAFKQAKKDDEVRVIVLTGAGKAFCSGQDLKDTQGGEVGERNLGESVIKRYNPMIKAIYNTPKPVICRLNGVAAGAGCSLALACDMIIASQKASLIEVFVNIGLVLDSGSAFFLPRIVGSKKAFELCTMGTKITAQEALELGIVNRVAAPEKLDETVKKITDYYVKAPTKAVGIIKKMLQKSLQSDLNEMLQYEAYCQEIAGNTADYKEGVLSFVEKRKPQFQGK